MPGKFRVDMEASRGRKEIRLVFSKKKKQQWGTWRQTLETLRFQEYQESGRGIGGRRERCSLTCRVSRITGLRTGILKAVLIYLVRGPKKRTEGKKQGRRGGCKPRELRRESPFHEMVNRLKEREKAIEQKGP